MLKIMIKMLYYMLKPRVIRKLCCTAEPCSLHTGGSVCLANLGGSFLYDGGSWRPGVPFLVPTLPVIYLKGNIPKYEFISQINKAKK